MRILLPGSPQTITQAMIKEEEEDQARLLRNFRRGSGDDVVEFNQWMTTMHGENGWRVEL